MTFKDTLAELRALRDISQSDMARLLKIGRRTYLNYELGITEPRHSMLVEMSKILQVSPAVFFQNTCLSLSDHAVIKRLGTKHVKLS